MNKTLSLLYRLSVAALASGALLLGGVAIADEEEHGHMDALVFQDAGKVQMGFIDVDCFGGAGEPGCDPDGEPGNNVYEAELEGAGVPVGSTGTAEEPGFFAIPAAGAAALPYGSVLPGNAAHSMDMVFGPSSIASNTSILFWDGAGSVNWSGVPNGETFFIEGNGGSGGVLSGSSVLSGIDLDATDSNGFFDTHPDFTLNGGGSSNPTDGFYALFGVTNIAGLTSSDRWAVVFGFGPENEEAHEAAVENLASIVPEPGTAFLMGLGLVGLAINGRRRHV